MKGTYRGIHYTVIDCPHAKNHYMVIGIIKQLEKELMSYEFDASNKTAIIKNVKELIDRDLNNLKQVVAKL